MAILFSKEIYEVIEKELKNASDSVQIITAFCKENTFQQLDKCVSSNVLRKRLLVRFRKGDLISGSSDLSVLETALNHGWDVYLKFNLHAKTYVVDNKRGIIGSANITNSGLSLNDFGNVEMATVVAIEPKDISKIEKLYSDSIVVNSSLIDEMKKQLSETRSIVSNGGEWSPSILNLYTPQIDVLFSYELPNCDHISRGEYISFLDMKYEGDIEVLKSAIRLCNAFIWLRSTLREAGGELYFGALTQKLHSVIVSDPAPYRKDVKLLLSNFLSIIQQANMDEIRIDKPNYSQRISLVD